MNLEPPAESAKTDRSFLRSVAVAFVDLIYPPLCRICGEPVEGDTQDFICSDCWSDVREVNAPFCNICGIPGALDARERCSDCSKQPPPFALARAAGIYEGALRETIHQYKFRYKEEVATRLGAMLVEAWDRWYREEKVDIVTPVPLHWTRHRWREFNQSEGIARVLCESRSLVLSTGNLVRRRRTRRQSSLRGQRREGNVRNAFRIRSPEEFEGKSVLLIDDVLTSGSTVGECCRVLLAQGYAKRVLVLTVARALRSG